MTLSKLDKILTPFVLLLLVFAVWITYEFVKTSDSPEFQQIGNCEFRMERHDNKFETINCFKDTDGSWSGSIEAGDKEEDYWNATYYYIIPYESIGECYRKKDYSSFRDLKSAEIFLDKTLRDYDKTHKSCHGEIKGE